MKWKWLLACLCALSLGASATATAEELRVMVITTDDASGVPAILQVQDPEWTIDEYARSLGSVELEALLEYDVVVVWGNHQMQPGWPVSTGNALADYIDAGGGVVELPFAQGPSGHSIEGRWRSGNYACTTSTSSNISTSGSLGTVHLPGHDIMAGVNAMSTSSFRTGAATLKGGCSLLASYNDGQILAAVRDTGASRVVWLGFYPGDGAIQGFGSPVTHNAPTRTGDWDRLLRQSVLWAWGGRNRRPIAEGDAATTSLDTPVEISVLTNDSDPDGDVLRVASAQAANNGTTQANEFTVTYTPNNGFTGQDGFVYTVTDGNGGTREGFVSVDVGGQTLPPEAQPDVAETPEDTSVVIDIIANDTDPDTPQNQLAIASVGQSLEGTVEQLDSRSVRVTPAPDFNGELTFSYEVTDGIYTRPGGVTVTVLAVNDAPVMDPLANRTNTEQDPVVGFASATDVDFDTLTFSATNLPPGVTIQSDTGDFVGSIGLGSAGVYNVEVTATDGIEPGTGTFTWTVVAQSRATPDFADGVEDTPAVIDVLANDVEPGTLTLSSVADPDNGTAEIVNQMVHYTPDPNFAGVEVFLYTATDAGQNPHQGRIEIFVSYVNDPPAVVDPGTQNSLVGQDVLLVVTGTDVDGDSLSFDATGLPGGLFAEPNGRISGRPLPGTEGTHQVTLVASDGQLTGELLIDWIVTSDNEPPSVTTPNDQNHGEGANVFLPIQATDPDGDTLSYAASGLPAGLSIHEVDGVIDGIVDFSASDDSPYSVTVSVTDGEETVMATFQWTITNTNRMPTVETVSAQSSAEGQEISVQVVANDPDGDTLAYSSSGLPSGLTVHPTTGEIMGTIDFNAAGNHSVFIDVTDGELTVFTNFSWVVADTNQPPEFLAPFADRTDAEGVSIALDASAIDGDDDDLTWSASNLPPGLTLEPANGSIRGTLTFQSAGEYETEIRVADGEETAAQSFVWTVTELNQTPQLTSPGDQLNQELDDINLAIQAIDGDGDPITFAAQGLPPGLSIDEDDGVISGTLGFDAAGVHSVTLSASDGIATVQVTIQWTVLDRNRPPVLEAIGSRSDTEGDTVTFNPVGSDPDGDDLDWFASQLPRGLTIDPDTGSISGIIGFDALPSYRTTIEIHDGSVGTSVSFDWVITNRNQVPVVTNPGAQSHAEGDDVTLQIQGNDPDGDDVIWSATGLPPGLAIEQNGIIRGSLGVNSSGTYNARVGLSDGDDAAEAEFVWVVDDVNFPPVFNSPGTQENAEGQTISLLVNATDPDEDTLTYTALSLPDGLGIDSDTGRISGVLSHDSQGNHVVTVTADDGQVETDLQFAWRVININRPPVIDPIPDQTGSEGQPITLLIAASDPDGQNLSFAARGLPLGLSIHGDTGRITGTLGFESAGQHEVFIDVSDGEDTSIGAFTWTVAPTNRPPTVTHPGDQRSVEGREVTLAMQGADPDRDDLTWTAVGLPPDLAIDADTGVISGTVSLSAEGNYTTTVRNSDGDLSGQATFGWEVVGTNQAPTVTLPDPLTASEGELISLRATGVDPDGDVLEYAWDLNDDGNYDDATGRDAELAAPDGPGQLRVLVRVTDRVDVAFAETVITSVNVAPTLGAITSDPPSPLEGQRATLDVEAADPADDVAVTWDYGDGDSDDLAHHIWRDAGTYTVGAAADDGDGGEDQATTELTVLSVPPRVVNMDGLLALDEGSSAIFGANWQKATVDTATTAMDWGDGQQAEPTQLPTGTTGGVFSEAHSFADNGTYTVQFTITDDDGDSDTDSIEVVVSNVAPSVTSMPGLTAVVDLVYTYEPTLRDPGDDVLSLSLTQAPEGMEIVDDEIRWTPTPQQAIEEFFDVTLQVEDDDGATGTQSWTVQVAGGATDSDMDGVPDVVERLCGLDPEAPDDADMDPDQDGIDSGEECQNGTDPFVSNAPGALTQVSPIDRARVDTRLPEFVVMNAVDPDGDTLNYRFEVYLDLQLQQPVVSGIVREGEVQTRWTVTRDLDENGTYFWRARATDDRGAGPWSPTWRFRVDEANEAPSIPVPLAPRNVTDAVQPTLLVEFARDPEGDTITYLYELYRDRDLRSLVEEGNSNATSLTVETVLDEDFPYYWRAAARDEFGAQSDWSDALFFRVNGDNRAPDTPTIVLPEADAIVAELPTVFRFNPASDPDLDPVTHAVQVASDEGFTDLIVDESNIDTGTAETWDIDLDGLEEDQTYHARVWAFDGLAHGTAAQVRFTVNAENTPPPAPTPVSPVGAERLDRNEIDEIPFAFTPVIDPDGDELRYTIAIFRDEALTEGVFNTGGIVGEGDPTVRDVATPGEDGTYWWTVHATDARGLDGPAGGPESFTLVSDVNDPPTAPELLSPIDDEIVDVAAFDLVATNATDPEGEELTYGFTIYADASLTEPLWTTDGVAVSADTGEHRAPVQNLAARPGTTLSWIAWAEDPAGNRSPSSAPAHFVFGEATANNGGNNGGNNGNNGDTDAGTDTGDGGSSVTSAPAPDDCGCQTPAAPRGTAWWRALLRR